MYVGDFPLTTLVETTRDDPAWCEITDSCYAWRAEAWPRSRSTPRWNRCAGCAPNPASRAS